MGNGFKPNYLIHPGVFLKDHLNVLEITQKELSEVSGVQKTVINEIISGKRRISGEIAVKLEYAGLSDAQYWLNLQSLYDETKARIEIEEACFYINKPSSIVFDNYCKTAQIMTYKSAYNQFNSATYYNKNLLMAG